MKPNLFVIGAMKCGTTSLHRYLGAHPDIFMSDPKEPTHFVDREQLRPYFPEISRNGYWDLQSYLNLFEPAKDRKIIGESSTNYSKLPNITGVAERIWDFERDAKILYIIRDPVERAISHFKHALSHRLEYRSIVEAVTQNPHYRAASYYAMQLRPYMELFGPQQIKVATLEDLRQDPLSLLSDIFEWLGVEKTLFLQDKFERYHVTPDRVLLLRGAPFLRKMAHGSLRNAMRATIPETIRAVIKKPFMRELELDRGTLRKVVDYLRPIQKEQTKELSTLLGREFPEWGTLHGE